VSHLCPCLDSDKPPASVHIIEEFTEILRRASRHPHRILDLAPTDFHFFGLLKENLRGHMVNDETLENAVRQWLQRKESDVLWVEEPALVQTWKTIVGKDGEYFNLLKPTGYTMHQQFNIQQLYVLPTSYLCVLYLSENKQRLVSLTE
jgi:hypothetical protein